MTSAVREPVTYELADYGRLLRRRGWIILVLVALGLVAGAALLHAKPKVYSSSVSVLVRDVGVGDAGAVQGGRTSSSLNLDTEAQIVKSEALAAVVGKALGSPDTPAQVASYVTVTVPPNTSVLTLTYVAPSPKAAQAGAQAYARSYLDSRQQAGQGDVANQIASLKTQAADLETALRDVTGRIASLPDNSPDRQLATAQQTVLVNQLTSLNARLSPLVGQDVRAGRIISDASLPTAPSSPVPALYLAAGLMVGLLLGIALAVAFDRTDRRVRRPVDVERLLELALLGNIPKVRQPGVLDSADRGAEAFRGLRNAVEAQLSSTAVVLVTGASGGVGGSFVAANLGAALARGGRRAVVLCCDRDDDRTAGLLGVEDSAGQQALLVPHPLIQGLDAWLPGPSKVRAADAGAASALDDTLGRLRLSHDYVIISAPSAADSADAQGLAFHADAALVVVEAGRTARQQVADAVHQLTRVRCSVLGAVVVTVPGRRTRRQKSSPAAVAGPPTEPEWTPSGRDLPAQELAPTWSDEPSIEPSERS